MHYKVILSVLIGMSFFAKNVYAEVSSLSNLPAVGTINKIVVLGDSLSDIGNYKGEDDLLCADPSAPVTNKTGGSNPPGWLWVNHLAEYYGVPVVSGSLEENRQGTIWGFSGARTNDYVCEVISDTDLKKACEESISLEQQGKGINQYQVFDEQTLVILFAGANDVIQLVRDGITKEKFEFTLIQAMNYTAEIIEQLHRNGAKNFLIINLPDITLTPGILILTNPEERKELKEQVIDTWNTLLFSKKRTQRFAPLLALKEVFGNNIMLYTWDLGPAFQTLVDDPEAHGFQACFYDDVSGQCSRPDQENNNFNWCYFKDDYPNPDLFIFADLIHPTTRTHEILFNFLLNEAQVYTL